MFYDLTTKIDMHVHTMEGSPDAKIPARELVRLYKEAGYGAIVITEHVCENSPKLPMEERIEKWTSGYREAKDEGDKIGVQVFLGAEVVFLVVLLVLGLLLVSADLAARG